MISEKSLGGYWAAGVTVEWDAHRRRWSGEVAYYDDGFANDEPDSGRISTEGVLRTRYKVGSGEPLAPLGAVVRVLIKDAVRLGIRFERPGFDRPFLYLAGGSESDPDNPLPKGWQEMLAIVASRYEWDTYEAPKPETAEPLRREISWEVRAHEAGTRLPREQKRLLLGYLAAVACAPRDFGTPADDVLDWYTAEVPDSTVKVEWYVMPHQILVLRVTDLAASEGEERAGADG